MISIEFESGRGYVARCSRTGFVAYGHSEMDALKNMDIIKTNWMLRVGWAASWMDDKRVSTASD